MDESGSQRKLQFALQQKRAEDYSKQLNTCYSSLAESLTRMRQCRKLAEHQDIVLRKSINKMQTIKAVNEDHTIGLLIEAINK